MVGLDDLTPGRRAYLQWFHGRHSGAESEDLDRMIRAAVSVRCAVPLEAVEVLGPALSPTATTPVAVIRRRLIATYGATCMTCPTRGECVDHDHATSLVRGLLCNWCNGRVDRCLHVDGCAYARYLTAPPALTLRIRYPNRGRRPRPAALNAEERRALRAELARLREFPE